ncbi:anti-sigma factor family protein [Planctomicrobium sp. SH668]|uniref:anti-sigma factor family protein n=1 Tax=Planctomicrobium sp. SH668 TaxID=3448126 RepID=UPI003F5C2CB9
MDKLSRLTAEDRDNLTAYLDGELDENSTRRIESILTSSSVARNDVEILARTYDLLDLLPKPKGGTEFTERTMSTVKQESVRKPISEHKWFGTVRTAGILLGITLAFLISSSVGFLLTNQIFARSDDLLLDQYPLIQNLDSYQKVHSVEFLNELAAQRQLLEQIRGASTP